MQKTRMPQIIIIILCLLGYQYATAQSDYVVLVQGDTIHGKVTYLNYGVDKKVQVVDDSKKKTIYSMLQVRSFQMNDEPYHLVKMYDQYVFMKPVSLGYLSLYNFQIENQVSWDGLYLHKKDGRGIEVPNIGFKKRMTEFLSDCQSVADLVNEGDLGRKELDTIIIKFNECIELMTKSYEVNPTPAKTSTKENSQLWNDLESSVRKSENLDDKETILEMITEAKSKASKGEKIPNFIADGLKKSLENQPQLKDLLNRALMESNNK